MTAHKTWSKDRFAETVSSIRSGARLIGVKGVSWLPDGMLQDVIEAVIARIDQTPTVDTTDIPANGEVLTYDSASGKYHPAASGSAPVTSVFTRTGAVTAASGDYNAGQITNTPAGNIAATTAQAALNELDSEKPPTTRAINTTAPLTGGGDLSANRTLAVSAATGSAPGVAQIASQAQADAGTDDATIMTPLKVATRPQKNVVFETFIAGLDLVWASPGTNGTNISATAGAAWIPSLGRVYNASSAITGPSMTFSASTWYYVYLYDNSSTPALDISTTAPAAPYKGSARTKTADTSRRFLGALRTDAAGTPAVYNFIMQGSWVKYRVVTSASPHRALSAGSATTATAVSMASVVPPTSQLALIRITNTATNATGSINTDTSDSTGTGVGVGQLVAVPAAATGSGQYTVFLDHPTNTSQELRYWFSAAPTGGTGFIDVYGYINQK